MSITERNRRILFLEARRAENDAGEEEVTGWDALFHRRRPEPLAIAHQLL